MNKYLAMLLSLIMPSTPVQPPTVFELQNLRVNAEINDVKINKLQEHSLVLLNQEATTTIFEDENFYIQARLSGKDKVKVTSSFKIDKSTLHLLDEKEFTAPWNEVSTIMIHSSGKVHYHQKCDMPAVVDFNADITFDLINRCDLQAADLTPK